MRFHPHIERKRLQTPDLAMAHYAGRWKEHSISDTPEQSGQSLAEDTRKILERFATQDSIAPFKILDIGSGRQVFEKWLTKSFKVAAARNRQSPKKSKPAYKIFSLDKAPIDREYLESNPYLHVQADGKRLPFADNTFDIIVADHAMTQIDLKTSKDDKNEVYVGEREIWKALKMGGRAFLRLDTPELAQESDTEEEPFGWKPSKHWEQLDAYRQAAHEQGLIFTTANEIRDTYTKMGFVVVGVNSAHGKEDHEWWEVSLVKPHEFPLNREKDHILFKMYEDQQIGSLKDLIEAKGNFKEHDFRLLIDDELQERRQEIDVVQQQISQLKQSAEENGQPLSTAHMTAFLTTLGTLRQKLAVEKQMAAEALGPDLALDTPQSQLVPLSR